MCSDDETRQKSGDLAERGNYLVDVIPEESESRSDPLGASQFCDEDAS